MPDLHPRDVRPRVPSRRAGRPPPAAGAVDRGIVLAFVLGGLVLGGVLWAVGRGGAAPEGDLLEAVPAQADGVAFVARPDRVLAGLDRLTRRVGYARQVTGLEESLQRQLGFDVTDPGAWAERGVDPERGLAAYALEGGAVAVVPVSDVARFEGALLSLLAARGQARPGPEQQVEGHRVKTAEGPDGRLLVAWTRVDGVVRISSGPGAVARVAADGAEPGPPPGLARARRGLGVAPDLLAWLPAIPTGGARGPDRPGALGLVLREDGLDLLAWAPASAEGPAAALGGQAPADGALGRLDPGASLVARISVDLEVLWAKLTESGRLPARAAALAMRLKAAGVDVAEDLLPLLGDTWLLDLGVAPSPDVTRLASLDPRRSNPFEYLQLGIRVPVTDPEALAAHLPAVAEALGPALGARVVPGRRAGVPVWTVRYRLGEGMTFGVVDGVLLVTGGAGAFEEAADRVRTPEAEVAASFQPLAGAAPVAAVVHVPNLLAELRGLGAESFGGGPAGVMMRSAFQRLASPLANLRPVNATAEPAESGVAGRLELRLVPEVGEGG